MIKEIKIENFKSIESLNLELGRLNVFIGANGSGKSNILEGIAYTSAVNHGKVDNEFLFARGVRVVPYNLITSAFSLDNNSDVIVNFKSHNGLQAKLTINPRERKTIQKQNSENFRTLSLMQQEIEELKKTVTGLFNHNVENNNFNSELITLETKLKNIENELSNVSASLPNFLIFCPENYFLRRFEEESQIRPLGIRGEGLFSHLVEISKESPNLFKKINEHLQLLDWFDGFEIPNDLMFTERRIKIKDRYLEEGLQYFDQRSANEGFLYLLFYLTLFISDETPKFFAIDNIDNAMNPKLGRELIKILAKLAKEHDKQTILTTHNPSVLDGLDLNDDEQRLFVVYRNGDGHTKVKRVFKKEMPAGIAPMPLSELFLKGIIGGLPKNF